VATGWPAVRDKCRDLGISFRWWQHPLGQLILAKRANGKYAATIGGTGLSIPRQVGKTFLVGAIVFALCLLRPNLTVIWTAHRLRTAEETFGKMQAFAKRKKIAPHIAKIVLGSGDEEIVFRNGSRILFGARERGFGRGFDEVDVLIFDEAQILTESALDDMIPATNQSREPTGALLLFMGTPPKPSDPGEVFTRMRNEALSGEDDDTGWVEFGADADYGPTPPPAPLSEADWRQVAKANPSFPADTPREAILRMRKKLGGDSFLREGLGIWPDVNASKNKINMTRWATLATAVDKAPTRGQVVVDVAPDLSWTSVAVASEAPDGRTLMLVERTAGTLEAVEQVQAVVRNLEETIEVALTPTAKVISADLTKVEIEHKQLNEVEVTAGCAYLLTALNGATIAHVGQQELDDAARVVKTRLVGNVKQWDVRDRAGDVTAIRAASVAGQRWVMHNAKPDTPPPPPRKARTSATAAGSIATAGF
jgi:hypothetical protein